MMKYFFISIVLLIAPLNIKAQEGWKCVKGGNQSKFSPNPQNKINDVFKFDYQIYSTITYKSGNKIKQLKTHYYANSQDGTLFFPESILGMNNFDEIDNHFRFDGALRLANGQLVIYLYDQQNQKKRAFTVDSKKTASDSFLNNHTVFSSFFNDRNDPDLEQENPEPLLADFDWDGILHGYTGDIYNNSDKAKMTLFLDEQPMLLFRTSVPLCGFLGGIFNYLDADKCNALIVFNKIEMENGDYIQEALKSINPETYTFNGISYEPFGLLEELTSGTGTNIQNVQANMAEFQSKIMEMAQQMQQLKEQKRECRDSARGDEISDCNDHFDPLIKEVEDQMEQLQRQLLKSMGAEDLMDKN